MGLITSIGNDRATVGQNLIDLRHGIENPDFLAPDSSPVKVAGTVKDFDVDSSDPEDWIYPAEYAVPRATIRSFSPHVLYAWCAVKQAILDASLSDEDLTDPDAGLYSSSGGSMRSIHQHFQKMDRRGVMACNPLAIVASIAGTLTFNLVATLGIRGSSTGMVSACASSGHALGMALDEIRLGRQKRMLVVGAEDCNFESIVPFCGMRALSLETNPNLASRPFDSKRNGFVGTGGSVCLVLETETEARRRGATPYAKFTGWGQGSDGYNVAISHPEGRGLKDSMQNALKDAKVSPENIDYVNAHDRPLGLYYFGADKNEENEVTSRTISGGVTINDLLVHATQEGLPFGGVGASGMGAYNGIEGFKNFSHAKPIYRQTPIEKALQMMRPPYAEKFYNLLKSMAN